MNTATGDAPMSRERATAAFGDLVDRLQGGRRRSAPRAAAQPRAKARSQGDEMANRLLRWFDCDHLPADLQAVAAPIRDLARQLDEALPESAEKTAGFRKLVEAKDCLVRTVEARG